MTSLEICQLAHDECKGSAEKFKSIAVNMGAEHSDVLWCMDNWKFSS